MQPSIAGAVAGAAATTILDLSTYLDMAIRGRPASSATADVIRAGARRLGVRQLAEGEDDATANRRSALGSLAGYGIGIGIGTVYGAIGGSLRGRIPWLTAGTIAGAAAMFAADYPMTALGVTDPREWDAATWLSDAVPHLIYGIALAAIYEAVATG